MSMRVNPMSFIHDLAAMTRRSLPLVLAVALITPGPAAGQNPRPSTRRTEESRARLRETHDALLEKVDSLRWEFEHERLSEAERERLRQELSIAFRALEASMDRLHDEEMALAREASRGAMELAREAARAQAWGTGGPMKIMIAPMARPRGYLGLSFDGPNSEDVRDDELFIRFYQYPMIALVEPSSPAERAGIRKGDTLLALSGTDVVSREISLTKLLVPDERITVRVRRSGDTRDLAVVVGRAPDYVRRRAPAPMVAPAAPSAPVEAAPPAPRAPMVWSTSPRATVWVYNEGIGGAKIETVTDGLGRALGVKSGVLVVRAVQGTPAHDAGLRDGDVIIKVAGRPVASIRELRDAVLEHEHEDGLKLTIVRERKQRELRLRTRD